jgi:hypothetical protein
MARPGLKTLGSLEGKLGTIRHEVQQVLRGLKREIARREAELAGLKAQYARGAALLSGPAPRPAAPTRRRAKRAKAIDWKKVFGSLPARFTLAALADHPQAGKRPKSHLYAIVSRWKKEKKLATDPAGGYRKLDGKPRKSPAPRRKPAAAAKPTPASEPSAS